MVPLKNGAKKSSKEGPSNVRSKKENPKNSFKCFFTPYLHH